MNQSDPRFPAIWQLVERIDPEVANIRAKIRLNKLLKLQESNWHFFSQPELAAIDVITNIQIRSANKLQDIQAERWARECEIAYKTPPGRG